MKQSPAHLAGRRLQRPVSKVLRSPRLAEARLSRREARVGRHHKLSAPCTPMPAVVRHRAGSSAVAANDQVDDRFKPHLDEPEFAHGLDAPTEHAVLIGMRDERIKAFVAPEHEGLGVSRGLERAVPHL